MFPQGKVIRGALLEQCDAIAITNLSPFTYILLAVSADKQLPLTQIIPPNYNLRVEMNVFYHFKQLFANRERTYQSDIIVESYQTF